MPWTHQRARDFLAVKANPPPLAQHGLSPERLRETEASGVLDLRVQEALTALASSYHQRLKDSPEVLDWLRSRYRISDDTIDSLSIGYAVNGPTKDNYGKEYSGVISALTNGIQAFTPRELAATGAFRPTSQGNCGLIVTCPPSRVLRRGGRA